jgi:hypothetical protein
MIKKISEFIKHLSNAEISADKSKNSVEIIIYQYLRKDIIEDIKELIKELIETENNQRLLADKIDECNLNCPDLMVDEFEMIEKINQIKGKIEIFMDKFEIKEEELK